MAATSRSMVSATPTLSSPNWAGCSLGPKYLMPAGGKLDNTAFGAADSGGHIPVPSGTVVGRTIAERDAGSPFGPAADTDVDIYITAFDCQDALVNDDVELARPYAGLVVKENFLATPLASLTTAIKAAIRARYTCVNGVA